MSTGMTEQIEVLFNGECPICSREVGHYARLTDEQDLPIRYDSLCDAGRLEDWGISKEVAAKRLHVRKDAKVVSGLPAFILLWQEIPQTQWLARIAKLPAIHGFGCALYDYVLAPLLYRMHVARRKKVT